MQKTDDNVIQQLGLTSYEMSTSINLAQRAFKELLKTCLGHHGLTIPQWSLLGYLYKHESARPAQVANILGIKASYIAKIITELTVNELIESTAFPDDGRGKTIRLTDAGIERVRHTEQMLEECLNDQLGDLKKHDLLTYFTLTDYIAQNVQHHSL